MKMKQTDNIFVYGTLQNPVIRSGVIGKEVKTYIGLLKGFKRGEIIQDGIKYPIIRHTGDTEDFIEGVYFKVDDEDLQNMDKYEGEGYIRKRVTLVNGIEAWVYCE